MNEGRMWTNSPWLSWSEPQLAAPALQSLDSGTLWRGTRTSYSHAESVCVCVLGQVSELKDESPLATRGQARLTVGGGGGGRVSGARER